MHDHVQGNKIVVSQALREQVTGFHNIKDISHINAISDNSGLVDIALSNGKHIAASCSIVDKHLILEPISKSPLFQAMKIPSEHGVPLAGSNHLKISPHVRNPADVSRIPRHDITSGNPPVTKLKSTPTSATPHKAVGTRSDWTKSLNADHLSVATLRQLNALYITLQKRIHDTVFANPGVGIHMQHNIFDHFQDQIKKVSLSPTGRTMTPKEFVQHVQNSAGLTPEQRILLDPISKSKGLPFFTNGSHAFKCHIDGHNYYYSDPKNTFFTQKGLLIAKHGGTDYLAVVRADTNNKLIVDLVKK